MKAQITLTSSSYPLSASDFLQLITNAIEKKLFPWLIRIANVGAIICLMISILITVDVMFFRLVLGRPLSVTIEILQAMLSMVVFLGMSYAMVEGAHVSVDMISSKYTAPVQEFFENLFGILTIFLFTVIGVENFIRVQDSISTGEVFPVSGIPYWPFLTVAGLGCTLMTIVAITNLLKNATKTLKDFPRPAVLLISSSVVALVIIVLPMLLKSTFGVDLGYTSTGLTGICVMIGLMLLGIPIAFTMGITGVLGAWYLNGSETALGIVRTMTFETSADFFFSVIPLYILLGYFCFYSGISEQMYDACRKWMGNLKGGIAMATTCACGGFAAICGDSMATAATMGSVALPEMEKAEYDSSLACGSVAAGGTLGILIPPSMGFVVYGVIAEQSIGKLFVAGIIPGIILVFLFCLVIYLQVHRNPILGPPGGKVAFRDRMASLKGTWKPFCLFLLVIGGIYSGMFSPTEAAGVGCAAALIIFLTSKKASKKGFMDALMETLKTTAMIFTILIGVTLLGYFIGLSQIPLLLSEYIASLDVSRYLILIIILLLYVVLGMLMNIIPMIMLTLPILFPTVMSLGFDPIWYGVIMVIMMEMGQITPPVGINVFVIYGVAKKVSMGTIFKGIWPFVLAQIVLIIFLTVFPDIALFLPGTMDMLPELSK